MKCLLYFLRIVSDYTAFIYNLVTIIFNHLQHYSINNAVLTSVSLIF